MSYVAYFFLRKQGFHTRFNFFDDPIENGRDAVFGLDVQLMKLVHFFKSAALGYGTARLELSLPRGLVLAPFIPKSERGMGIKVGLHF